VRYEPYDPKWVLRALLLLFGVPILLVGILATVSAVRTYVDLHVRGIVADATVVEVTSREHGQPTGQSYDVLVLFATATGPVREQLDVRGTPDAGVEAGAHLQVTYHSADPSTVEVTGWEGWVDLPWAVGPLVVGVALTAYGGRAFVDAFRRRRSTRSNRYAGFFRPKRWDGL
jgi:hypothetical protein